MSLDETRAVKAALGDRTAPGQAEAFSPHETGQTVAAGQLRAFVERIEKLNEDAAAINEDKRNVFAEMKATGFDTKAVKTIVRLRAMDAGDRQEAEAILDLYKAALGME